jgi:tetratricopeptide (TPR) repeat protein
LLKAENIIKDEQLNNTQDLNQLKSHRIQLQNARNLITTIPKSWGSRYQEAQADLQELEQSLMNVNQLIELEENSRQNLTLGFQLFQEVEKSFPTLPGKSQRIKEADEKLETAIGLLQSVPSQAQVFYQVEAPLNKAQVLRGLLKNHIQSLNQLEVVNHRAMEASQLVQNPPHSVDTWKQAKDKWDEAIRLLSEIVVDEDDIKIQVQQKLKTYQANSKMIESQISNEEKAFKNWQQSLKLGNEVAQMVQNSPHPSVVWESAQSKCETAVKGLLSIPSGTSVYSQAQNKIKTYQGNCTVFRQKKKTEENYERIITNAQETLSLIKTNLQKTPHTIQKLNLAVSQIEQAIKLLETLPSETDSLQQAQELQVTLVKYQSKITETLEEIARCQTNSFYTEYCFELNMPIYLDYMD